MASLLKTKMGEAGIATKGRKEHKGECRTDGEGFTKIIKEAAGPERIPRTGTRTSKCEGKSTALVRFWIASDSSAPRLCP
jgi:hypothetical protein